MGDSAGRVLAGLVRPAILMIAGISGLTFLAIAGFLVFSVVKRQMGAPVTGEHEIVVYGMAIAASTGLPVAALLTARWSRGGLPGLIAASAESAIWIWLAVLALRAGLAKVAHGEQTQLLELPASLPVFVFGGGAALAALLRFAYALAPAGPAGDEKGAGA